MYDTLNRYVKDMTDLNFEIVPGKSGQGQIQHASAVANIMPTLGGYNYAQYIDLPLALHISDRDYYSFPEWNHDLASRVTKHGGKARVYIYPGNTHSLKVSEHTWFSPAGSTAGNPIAIDRDAHLFRELGFAD
jgi:dienelactone hydrolase